MMKHKRVIALMMAGMMVLSQAPVSFADEWVDVEEELVGIGADFEEPAEDEFFEDDQIVVDDQWDETGANDVLMDEYTDGSVFDEALFDDEYLESTTENGNELYDDLVINDEEEVDEELLVSADDPEIVDYGTCGEAVNWAFDREGTLVISGSGEMQNYSEDSEAPWSYRHLDIKTIEIESGVTSIGDRAFEYCTSLTSTIITIPDSVTSIGNNAFLHCNLTSITIPKSVTSIGVGAFEHCEFLTIITIPDSVTSIGDSTFAYCKSVMRIEIPDSVTSIGEYAFSDCSSVTSIEIPNSVTSICDCAFQNCSSLESIEIPNSVTSIGKYAFDSCNNLTIITIPNSVTSIGDHAFRFCSSLTEIMIPDRVESIGLSAFYRCDNLNICANPDTYAATYVIENKEDFKSYHIHNYEDLGWVTTKAATCTDAGKKQRRCQECDFLDTGTIPATGHTPVTDPAVAPTCTKTGLTEGSHCGECNAVIVAQQEVAIDKDGHPEDKIVTDPAIPATTTSEGKTEGSHCSECGTVLVAQLVIPKTTVTEQITVTKKPTIKKPTAKKTSITVNWKHFKHKSKKTKKIWKKIKKVQVQCATDRGFTNIVKTAMTGKNKTSAAVKGLTQNTTYYVRVRYYDGTGYSKWSSVKKTKTKKK